MTKILPHPVTLSHSVSLNCLLTFLQPITDDYAHFMVPFHSSDQNFLNIQLQLNLIQL